MSAYNYAPHAAYIEVDTSLLISLRKYKIHLVS